MAQELDWTTFRNTINNTATTTAQTRHGLNPATQAANPPVPVSTSADVDSAVAHARTAFKSWSTTTFAERRAALHDFAALLSTHSDGFADMLVREQGKALSQAKWEMGHAVGIVKSIASQELNEVVIEEDEQKKVIQRHVPLGVCVGIVPWNAPVLLACGKIAAAIYAGNAMLLKPSPFTPYCGLKLGELGAQCFPPGVLQVLSGGDDLGPMLTDHDGVDKISFTGSSITGKKVMASCARTLKRVTLELGGNDAAVICDDVDVEAVVKKMPTMCFLISAQVCMMIKRLYVHERIYDRFRDALVAHISTLKSGPGHEEDVFFGPLQNSMQYEKVKDLFNTVINDEKVTPALGGTVESSAGYFITPTIIDNPPETSRIVTEEPFGPILPLLKWSDEEDVIARANDTKMGLGGSVWSKDVERAERMARRMEAGSVWVNSHFSIAPNVPFGGHKWSGIGVEWGLDGLKGYCNAQSLWVFKEIQ